MIERGCVTISNLFNFFSGLKLMYPTFTICLFFPSLFLLKIVTFAQLCNCIFLFEVNLCTIITSKCSITYGFVVVA